LLQAIDQSLYQVPRSIDLLVEWATTMLILAPRNRHPQTMAPDPATDAWVTVSFVSDDTPRTKPGTPGPLVTHGTLVHQGFEYDAFMALAGCQNEGHWLATPFTAEVNLGGEAAAALT
jgi:hypothetical protein